VTMSKDRTPRLYRVISGVLGVPLESVCEATGQDTIDAWDSLAHVHLIVALESEFSLSFTPQQALKMTSIPAILEVLRAMDRADA